MGNDLRLLLESSDGIETEMLAEILRDHEIESYRKEPGANQYLRMILGEYAQTQRQLYVKQEDYEKAAELLAVWREAPAEEAEEGTEDVDQFEEDAEYGRDQV